MVILNIYLITTILSMAVVYISCRAMGEKMKRDSIIISGEPSRFEFLHRMLPLLIPIFNILMALVFIFCFDEMYKIIAEQSKSR